MISFRSLKGDRTELSFLRFYTKTIVWAGPWLSAKQGGVARISTMQMVGAREW
jgi:hypothetical protein